MRILVCPDNRLWIGPLYTLPAASYHQVIVTKTFPRTLCPDSQTFQLIR